MQSNEKQKESNTDNISHKNSSELVKKDVLGVGITDASQNTILEFLVKSLQKSAKSYYVVTPNPEMVVLAHKNPEFNRVLNNAKIASNDGIGVGIAAQVLGIPLHERFTGVDLMENLCERVSDWPITVGFLGGGSGVAELTAECLIRKYPKLKVVFAGEEWDQPANGIWVMGNGQKSKIQNHTPYAIRHKQQHIDVLFVAFGVPKQEFWMAEKTGKIPVKVMIGVGGAFDYVSGKVPRAPKIIRSIGMEWLFRLFIQPWRIQRQLALVEFIGMVVKKRIDLSFRRNKVTKKSHT